jgi:hypothetical protein
MVGEPVGVGPLVIVYVEMADRTTYPTFKRLVLPLLKAILPVLNLCATSGVVEKRPRGMDICRPDGLF